VVFSVRYLKIGREPGFLQPVAYRQDSGLTLRGAGSEYLHMEPVVQEPLDDSEHPGDRFAYRVDVFPNFKVS